MHDALELDWNEFREYASFGQDPAKVAVKGVLIDIDANPAVGFLLVPTGQFSDRVWAQAWLRQALEEVKDDGVLIETSAAVTRSGATAGTRV